jgi:hypothetical protein
MQHYIVPEIRKDCQLEIFLQPSSIFKNEGIPHSLTVRVPSPYDATSHRSELKKDCQGEIFFSLRRF